MSKIGLKPWQHFVLLGILAVLVIIFIVANLRGGEREVDSKGNMFARFEIEYQNADSVMRLFYPGVIVSDSIRYEEIKGGTSGFVIQVFLVGQECDYILKIDNRDTKILPEEGDTLVFTNYFLSEKVYSNFTLSLESRIELNPTSVMTDELVLTDYYASVMCNRKDSCISIKGVATASAYIVNPMFDDDQLFIYGYFRADSIPIGKRTVN
ncbi:MAG: hypothetical protein C0592_11410 [Marinilabiliales bacterium]|nr:MAG: hypothetical protein C0592_11410 [Marinilabiliales bacterium]